MKYLGFGVQGLEFRAQGIGFKVYNNLNKYLNKSYKQILKFYKTLRVQGLVYRDYDLGFITFQQVLLIKNKKKSYKMLFIML